MASLWPWVTRGIAALAAAAITEANPPPGPGTTKSVGDNIRASRDGIGFVDTVRASLQPRTWLNAFQAAIDDGVIEAIESNQEDWFVIGTQFHPETPAATALDARIMEEFVAGVKGRNGMLRLVA